MRVSTRRGPMTSPSQPEGISKSEYASANALNTLPICSVVRSRSLVMNGAAAEMQTRSRYVMTASRKANASTPARTRDGEGTGEAGRVREAEADAATSEPVTPV